MADEETGNVYTIKTNQGNFGVRLNRAPTDEEAASLAEEYFAKTKSESKGLGGTGPFGAVEDDVSRGFAKRPTSQEVQQTGGNGTDLVLEAGIPMLGQVLTTEATPIVQGAVGGGLSLLGNVLAQVRRISSGEQKDFSSGQATQAAMTGAVPFAGPEANAARVARPILTGITNAGKAAVKMGAVGAAGENIKILIDEGHLAENGDSLRSALLPALFGAAGSAVGSVGESIGSKGRIVAENSRDYSSIAAKPTTGMLLPEDFAATEQRIARSKPGGEVADKIDAVQGELQTGIQSVAPSPQEGSEIFKSASPLIRQVSKSEDELAKLNQVAIKANKASEDAFAALGEAKSAGKADVQKAVAGEAEKLSTDAFSANLASATENAKDLAINRAVGGVAGVDPATGRDLFVEQVSKPVLAAFDKRAAELYSVVDNQAATFDAAPILKYARQLASDVTGGLPKKLDSAIALVADNLGGDGKVSLQALRNARSELLRKVRMGELDSNNEERLIKGISSEITRQIDSQAVTALGKEGGEGLLAANKFYREGKELFDQEGVDALFSSKPNDGSVRKVIAGMEKSGVNSDEYRNVQNLIARIGQDSPGLAESAGQHFNDIIKKSVIYDASRISPGSAGELVVDPAALFDSMRKLAKVPGTLEKLGLGSGPAMGELETLFAKYPDASKMGSKDWDQIFSSPAFRASVAGKPWSKTELATNLSETLAASQADNQIVKAANLRAAGKVDDAQKVYDKAVGTLRSVQGDVSAAQNKYESLLKDPVALAFNNPNLSETDFNSFAKALFDPKASKLANDDVRSMADALRRSPNTANKELLLRLQERYIADQVASYHSTPVSSTMLKHPDSDSVALFFNPVDPRDAANNIERARSLLEPAQLQQLATFAKTAKSISQYEKLGIVAEKSGSYRIPVVGMIRRGVDAVADLYREGKYNVAAKLLADPAKFSSVAIKVGDNLDVAENAIQGFGVGAGRSVETRRQNQRNQ